MTVTHVDVGRTDRVEMIQRDEAEDAEKKCGGQRKEKAVHIAGRVFLSVSFQGRRGRLARDL